MGLLNISEKPNTPQKLAISRKSIFAPSDRSRGGKSTGVSPSSSAMSQAASAATRTIITA